MSVTLQVSLMPTPLILKTTEKDGLCIKRMDWVDFGERHARARHTPTFSFKIMLMLTFDSLC
jgi:hypothetical protein